MPIENRLQNIYASAPARSYFRQVLVFKLRTGVPNQFITNHWEGFGAKWPDDYRDGAASGWVDRGFKVVPFDAIEPTNDDRGQFDLRIGIDNVDAEMGQILAQYANTHADKYIEAFYTVYTDTNDYPAIHPTLALRIYDVQVTPDLITGVATRADIVNAQFPYHLYSTRMFPGLDR